jgi:hypothetical protein
MRTVLPESLPADVATGVRSQARVVRRVLDLAAVAGVLRLVEVKAVAGRTVPGASQLLLPSLSAGEVEGLATLLAAPDLASATDLTEADHALKLALF